MKFNRGYTLIEILVVIGLIAILATMTIVAINPRKNFADTRNAQRSSDIAEIFTAITQYTSENGKSLTTLGTIAICPSVTTIGTGGLNLTSTLVDGYIAQIPKDPTGGTDANTGYTICKTSTGRVTVAAPSAENGKSISIKR